MTLDNIFRVIVAGACALAVFVMILQFAALMTWVERKLSAMIHDRIGPNRANIRLPYKSWLFGKVRWINITAWGLIHIMVDPIKLFFKEDFVPKGAHRSLHTLAPMIGLVVPFIVFCVIPFAGPWTIHWRDLPATEIWGLSWLSQHDWLVAGYQLNPFVIFRNDALHFSNFTINFVVSDLNVGMLFIFGVASLAVFGVILAGWSSNNKFSFLGAMRGANQMISYEVAMGTTAVGLFMIYGGVSLNTIVKAQGDLIWGVIPKWGFITQPLALLLFFACGMAEIKRVPFDLPEGESEIIAGHFLEYSSTKFTMFMFGEFVEMILLSAIITTLFLGGWQIPWVSANGIDFASWHPLWKDLIPVIYSHLGATGIGAIIALLQAFKFTACVVVVLYIIFMVRWTFPRFRYDQVMRMGWKMVLPLSLANIVVTGIVLAIIRGWMW
jgi:NADH-quinone oxidoreductase subunit H